MSKMTGRNIGKNTIIDAIREYNVFPIPENNLNVNAIIKEFDRIIDRSASLTGYIAYLCCPNGAVYTDWCISKGITPCSAQQRYNAKHHQSLKKEYWERLKFYELNPDTLLGEIAISQQEREMLAHHVQNFDKLTVKEFIEEVKITKLTSSPDTEDLVEYFGEINLPNHQLLVKAMWGRLAEEQARNLIYYEPITKYVSTKTLESLENERFRMILEKWLFEKKSLSKIAIELEVTGPRISQVVAKTLRMLRHPKRSSDLADLLEIPRDELIKRCLMEYVYDEKSDTSKMIDMITRSHHINLIATNKVVQAMLIKSPAEVFKELKDIDLLVQEEPGDQLLKMDIGDLNLSVRAYNALWRKSIQTVGQIIEFARIKGLANIRNLGHKSYVEIINRLEEIGVADLLPDDPANGENPGEETVNW